MNALNYGGCMCRECGALCDLTSWEDLGGLCWSCAYPKGRSPTKAPPVAFVNGVEIEGEDPIRAAIEKAAHNFLKDTGGDS